MKDDLISRQAAITAIQKVYADTVGGTDRCAVWKNVGLTNALHIMQDLPSVQTEKMQLSKEDATKDATFDCISRKAAIDAAIEAADDWDGGYNLTRAGIIADALNNVPSAQPERTETHSCDSERTETHDLVSRQAAIDAVKQHMNNVSGGNDEYYIAHRHIIELLQIVPTAEPESHREWYMHGYRDAQQRWTSVTERLPDDIRPVIVTWKNNDPESYYQHIVGKHFIGVAHFKGGKWYWYSSTTEDFLAEYGRYDGEEFDEAIEVVAWCELPEPYKGEQE